MGEGEAVGRDGHVVGQITPKVADNVRDVVEAALAQMVQILIATVASWIWWGISRRPYPAAVTAVGAF